MKTLLLEQNHNPEWHINPDNLDDPDRYRYRPMKVTNSTTPVIYDSLTKEQVDVYCESDEWEVTIK